MTMKFETDGDENAPARLRKPWSPPRVIESEVTRKTAKFTTPYGTGEEHDPDSTPCSGQS